MIKRLHPLLYSIITLSVAKTHSQNDMTGFTLILSMRCLRSWWKNYHLFTKLLEDVWVEATVVIKFTKNTFLCKKWIETHKVGCLYEASNISKLATLNVKQKAIYIKISVSFSFLDVFELDIYLSCKIYVFLYLSRYDFI